MGLWVEEENAKCFDSNPSHIDGEVFPGNSFESNWIYVTNVRVRAGVIIKRRVRV